MSGKSGGFTLIEMILAIVILGVGLGGVLAAFNTVVKSSADPMVQKQMLSIAEGTLEEILSKPYVPGPGVIDSGSCSRAEADDIGDYHGYGAKNGCGQPRDLSGYPIPNLSEYLIDVVVSTGASLGNLAKDVTRVTVTVSRGGESLSLIGYRTNYARTSP